MDKGYVPEHKAHVKPRAGRKADKKLEARKRKSKNPDELEAHKSRNPKVRSLVIYVTQRIQFSGMTVLRLLLKSIRRRPRFCWVRFAFSNLPLAWFCVYRPSLSIIQEPTTVIKPTSCHKSTRDITCLKWIEVLRMSRRPSLLPSKVPLALANRPSSALW